MQRSASKYLSGTRTQEHLSRCVELRADAKVREVATRRLDKKVLAALSRDLVAAEGHYHKSCYKLYTKNESTSTFDMSEELEEHSAYNKAVEQAHQELFMFIRNE